MLALAQARLVVAKAVALVENRIAVPDLDWLHRTFSELGLAAPPAPPPERDPEVVAALERDILPSESVLDVAVAAGLHKGEWRRMDLQSDA